MNRSSLCIKMLQILNAHDFVTTKELAERLETNPRNIIEFKKELEVAGYVIESVKGRYGGYRLVDKAELPMIRLSESEKQAMNDAYSYLSNHSDFLNMSEYTRAYEKIKSSITFSNNTSDIFFHENTQKVEDEVKEMIQICEKGKKENLAVLFEYRSLRSDEYQNVEFCPYEIMNIQGDYYCIGYSKSKHDFRIYKFSNARMRNMKCINKKFTKDIDFNVNAYIGKSGLMKDEVIEAEFIITGKNAILYSERPIGVNPVTYFDEKNQLHVKTLFEGKLSAIKFLCSLGSSCILISPVELKDEMKEEISKMVENYL